MIVETKNLTGPALDWAVARALGLRPSMFIVQRTGDLAREHRYSRDWAQGGPIIERERIGIWDSADEAHQGEFAAATREWMSMDVESAEFLNSPMPYHGPTALVAAMRCYVASRLGDEVDIPEELL